MKRKKLTRRGSRRLFKATANKTRRINVNPPTPMRGGFRI